MSQVWWLNDKHKKQGGEDNEVFELQGTIAKSNFRAKQLEIVHATIL